MNKEQQQPRTQDEHAASVSRLFSGIVKWYDFLNRLLSLGLDQGWRRCLADSVFPGLRGAAVGKTVLDLAAGTLDVSLALCRRYPGVRVLAMDFCPPMLVRGQGKLDGDDKGAFFRRRGRTRPPPCRFQCGWNHHGLWNPEYRASVGGLRRNDACTDTRRTGLYSRVRDGAEPDMAWRVQLLFAPRSACDRTAVRRSRRVQLSGKNNHGIPQCRCPEREMHAAGFARVYHIPLCSGIVCVHVAEKA